MTSPMNVATLVMTSTTVSSMLLVPSPPFMKESKRPVTTSMTGERASVIFSQILPIFSLNASLVESMSTKYPTRVATTVATAAMPPKLNLVFEVFLADFSTVSLMSPMADLTVLEPSLIPSPSPSAMYPPMRFMTFDGELISRVVSNSFITPSSPSSFVFILTDFRPSLSPFDTPSAMPSPIALLPAARSAATPLTVVLRFLPKSVIALFTFPK